MSELLTQLEKRFIKAGAGIFVLCLAGLFFDRTQFMQSYLLAYLFWVGIALGCLAILMLQNLTGGAWGITIRPALGPATRTFPLLFVLLIPIFISIPILYPWAQP